MRDLSPGEIHELLDQCDWGTLLLVDGDEPYGIEVSHFIHEERVYFIINPEGKAASCIRKNPKGAYKVCSANLAKQEWSAATVAGTIERVTDAQKIYDSFILLAQRLNRDREKYKKLGQKFSQNPEQTPVHYLPIKDISGKASK